VLVRPVRRRGARPRRRRAGDAGRRGHNGARRNDRDPRRDPRQPTRRRPAPDSTPAPDPAPTIVWVAWGLCGVFAAIGFTVVTGPALFAVVLGWLRFAD
jgi:hypothetical protein